MAVAIKRHIVRTSNGDRHTFDPDCRAGGLDTLAAEEVKFITRLIDFGSVPSYGRKLFRLPARTFAEVTSHYTNSYIGTNLIVTGLRGKAFTMAAVIEEFHRDV